jgi:hypothetical protein
MQERDRHFEDAARVIGESRVVRAIVRGVAAVDAAIASSATAALVRRARVTQIGVVIASACVTHALLLQLLPDRLAPVRPLGYAVVLAFAAFAVAAGCITVRSRATATAESSAGTANAMNS